MTTHVIDKEGIVSFNWLLSGSDEGSIRIWNIQNQSCLRELIGHKNGVTGMSFANNQLFSSSYDHYVIVWSLEDI